jgi:hypothetical protein
MNLSEHPQLLAAGLLEVMLALALAAVAAAMQRMRVNGPCQLCLVLLVAWRACALVGECERGLGAGYFAGLAFAYVFLYAIYHLTVLIHDLRRWRAGPRAEGA